MTEQKITLNKERRQLSVVKFAVNNGLQQSCVPVQVIET